MNWAHLGDLHQAFALVVVKVATKADSPIQHISGGFPGQAAMAHLYMDGSQGPALSFGVKPQGLRRACGQGGGQDFMRRGAKAQAAKIYGFIANESRGAGSDDDLKAAMATVIGGGAWDMRIHEATPSVGSLAYVGI